jgi:hypothetical protein
LTASTIPQLRGRTPTEYVEGSTPNISAYALFYWYQPVFCLTPVIDYPHERKCIDRWLGVAEECTDEMAFTMIAGKAKVVVRKSLWAISDDKMAQPSIKEKLAKFDESVQLAYGQEWIYREESHADKSGIEKPRMTIQGWELLVQWTDGTTSWHPLADLKSSNPVEVAEYAVSQLLDDKPAFHWWVR